VGSVLEELKSRQDQHDSDPWIDLTSYMSLTLTKIPDDLHPVQDGKTRASSFFAVTGCDPRSDAIGSAASLAAIVGASSRYYLETIVRKDPEFLSIMWMDGRAMAVYPEPFKQAWSDREQRIQRERLEHAGAAAEHLRTDCSSRDQARGTTPAFNPSK
jgi:hypothetical protein